MKDFIYLYTKYPIGTKLRLKDDYPFVIRVVSGYEVYENETYLLFEDGSKLNIKRLEDIKEVLNADN